MKIFLFVGFLINAPKVMGPLGIWRGSNGPVYSAPSIPESTLAQDAFKFGDFLNMNNAADEGINFKDWLTNACETWNVERYTGIVLPPSEGGVFNDPTDTSLYSPKTGMVQGGKRFSRLSKIYGQIYGINIDDFEDIDTATVNDVRDALKGKYVDSAGTVHHETPETTPDLKLFVVIYPNRTSLPSEFVPYIDGINLWLYNQGSLYTNTDTYITQYRSNYPGKEINFGIYMMNADYGWMSVSSVNYMYKHLLNKYDDGYINGIMLFAGHWIIIPNITRTRWNNHHLPALLDTVYYPYIGEGEGKVYNQVLEPLDSVFISCYTIGRLSGDVLVRSKKRSDSTGTYHFNAWAGNRTTDSTLYYVVAQKEGYISDTVSGWIYRQRLTNFPDIILASVGIEDNSPIKPFSFSLSQNPLNSEVAFQFILPAANYLNIKIYDKTGREIKLLTAGEFKAGTYNIKWDTSDKAGKTVPPGIYFVKFSAGGYKETKKLVLMR